MLKTASKMVKKEIKAKMQELPSLDSPRSIVVPQQTEPDLIPYEAEEDDQLEEKIEREE